VKRAAIFSGLALAAGMFAFRANADEWDKKTILTIDQPIQITDTYLEPGTYVLKLDRSPSDRHIVRIYNERENHLYNTVLAYPNYRIRPTGNTRFTFYETPAGSAKALRAWFYPGDNFGQEFPYPKNLRQIAVATPAPARPAPPVVEPAPAPVEVEPQAAPEAPAPVAETHTQVEEQSEVEIAQNTPPPAPPAPPAAVPSDDQSTVNTQPELPHTASPLPLLGVIGLLSLGLFGLLRVKQLS
jgi:hypothetical protein